MDVSAEPLINWRRRQNNAKAFKTQVARLAGKHYLFVGLISIVVENRQAGDNFRIAVGYHSGRGATFGD